MHWSSSKTMNPPEPNIEPEANPPSAKLSYVIKRSSPAAVFVTKCAGKIGTEEPPGTHAFNFLPFAIPRHQSSP